MHELKIFLDKQVDIYNRKSFIANDPISIPHRFTQKQDREIAGLFAATLAWGYRKTILSKCSELMERMGNEPYQFVTEHGEDDLKGLLGFKHRTFNDTDLFILFAFFEDITPSITHWSLLFASGGAFQSVEDSLIRFQTTFLTILMLQSVQGSMWQLLLEMQLVNA